MRSSFKLHAGMQLALSGVGLLAAVLAAVPLLPPFADEWLLLGIGLALLVPLHLATLFRSIAVELSNRGFAGNKANQVSGPAPPRPRTARGRGPRRGFPGPPERCGTTRASSDSSPCAGTTPRSTPSTLTAG
ncbi:hypothetical protein GCM10017674_80570 [Streptomyces gardneri]|uniref:Uncharacterized protein n=1 Tax=Streptomyces gardneri TaxID=66892 RepID=A0A4Y3RKG7_9ACTN|nr:hypothetical protein SGA01_30330 [Streptomyces gardneri]GHH23725.1 hypothetical protein GCM10017674_80570 [Streptomyces gardneri]